MIKNEREFTSAVNEMSRRIKVDLQNQLVNFIETMGTSTEELAEALHVDAAQIVNILEGNGDEITLDTFMKIMIGSNHVLEIKPLEMTPFGGYGDIPRMTPPMGGRMTPPPHGMRPPMGGRMTPPPHGMTPPPMGGMMPPMGQPSGRFCGMPGLKRKNTTHPTMGNVPPMGGRMTPPPMPMPEVDDTLDRMSRKDLVDTIRENGWGEELDVATATRSELINFLTEKEFVSPSASATTNADVAETVGNPTADTERMARLLAEELERNPHLKDIVGRYVR